MDDDPRLYAAEHAHYDEDVPFWRALARGHTGPVLDLGCAVGRVAVPLAADGARVWALDHHPGMLEELSAAAAAAGVAGRITAVQADMRDFRIPERFSLVVAAMNTLQTLLTPEDQLACLTRVREHLAPGGELAFDVALPDLGEISADLGVVRRTGEHTDAATGATLVHSAWYDAVDPIAQTVDFSLQIDVVAADGTMTRRIRRHRVHVYHPSELGHLLARAGLRVREVTGDFAGAPVAAGAERQVYRCEAA